jgi:hypothetical protein
VFRDPDARRLILTVTAVNYQSNSGLSDVTSDQIRCYTSGTKAAQTQVVAAGSSVGFKASPNIFHPGPLQFYMAKVPSGQTLDTWDGKGQVWFKIYAEQATTTGGQLSWASLSTSPSISPQRQNHRLLTWVGYRQGFRQRDRS